MSLKLGTTTITKGYLGSTEITKAYLGSTEIIAPTGSTYGLDFALSESMYASLTLGTNTWTINVSVISVDDDTDGYIIGNYINSSTSGHLSLRTISSTQLRLRIHDGVSTKETSSFTYSSGDKITIARTSATNVNVIINDSGTPITSLTIDSGCNINNTYLVLGAYITSSFTSGLRTDLWDVTIGAGATETFLPTTSSEAPITGSEGTATTITGSPTFFAI